jgi:DGQHR domain-containing protein
MNYPCIVFAQRSGQEAPKFCVFQAPVGEILQWTTIPRLSPEDPGGIQRARNDYKVKAIKNFLAANPHNTIPTAIVVTLAADTYTLNDPAAPVGVNQIDIDPERRAGAFVVDGQHRLYGLNEFSSLANVPVVAILNADNEEKAFQFIVINNKVSKVTTDHIRALALNFTDPAGQEGLEARLKAARLSLSKNVSYVGTANESDDSPFKGMVSLPDTPEGDRVVVPAAIEAAIAYIQSKKIRQLSNEDSEYEFFISIWSKIKATWPAAFGKNSKLLSKVGILCMTRYVTDTVDFIVSFTGPELNLSNSEDVAIAVGRVLDLQSEQFWLVEWSISISDSKAVRDEIDEALKSIQQNIRYKQPWFTELKILKAGIQQKSADNPQPGQA